jgi:hypothetical protein
VLSEFSRHGIGSRVGKRRADLVHQPLDEVIVGAPWVLAGAVAYRGLRRLGKALGRSDGD